MPLPNHAALNGSFDLELSVGFTFKGPCARLSRISDARGRPIRAAAGETPFFAAVNNPHMRQADGFRSPDPWPTREYGFKISQRRMVHATGGAWLDCAGVVIETNEELRFLYNFVLFESQPMFNDFALFLAIDEDGAIVQREVLAEVRALGDVAEAGWAGKTWAPPRRFEGTLRWVASNGFVASPNDPPSGPSPGANSSPLLLDRVEVLPRATDGTPVVPA